MRKAVAGKRVQTCSRWLSVGKSVTNDSVFMFTYPYSNREMVLYHLCVKAASSKTKVLLYFSFLLVCLDVISWENSTFWSCSHFIPSLYFVFGFIFRGLMPLCSLVGQLFPSPRALCPRRLSALFCCQTRRLVRVKRSHSTDKAWPEGAPSPHCSVCLLRLASYLSTQDVFFLPILPPPPLSLYTHPHTIFLTFNYHNYIFIFFILLPNLKRSVKCCCYLTSKIIFCEKVKLLRLQPCLPPSVDYICHFYLSAQHTPVIHGRIDKCKCQLTEVQMM